MSEEAPIYGGHRDGRPFAPCPGSVSAETAASGGVAGSSGSSKPLDRDITGPTPYYRDAYCTIYHGDCREVLPTLPRANVLLTDPPYGVGESYASFNDTPENLDALLVDVVPLLFAAAPRLAITPGVGNLWRYPRPKWVMSWVTMAGAGSGPWGFCCWQPILVYGADPYMANGKGRRPDTIQSNESSEKNGHPCPKPVGVWMKILDRVSVVNGETVLDPFMGSGTTLRVAKDLGRQAIGIEIEERYCEIAARRLQQEVLNFTPRKADEAGLQGLLVPREPATTNSAHHEASQRQNGADKLRDEQ